MKRTYIALTFLALMVCAAEDHAQGLPQATTSTDSVTSGGSPVTGNDDFTLARFDARSAGNKLWDETHPAAEVKDVAAFVAMGSRTGLAAAGAAFPKPRPSLATARATAAALHYNLPAWAKPHRSVLNRISTLLARGDKKKALGLYRLFLRAAYQKRDPGVRAKLRRAVDVERWIVREAYLRHHPTLGTLVDKMRYHHTAEQRLNGCLRKLRAMRKTVGHKRGTACRIVLRRTFAPGANPVRKQSRPRLNAERLNDAIKEIESMVNRVRNERQMVSTQFEGASTTTKQILNMLSTVLRALSDARKVGVGHIRQ